VPEPDVLERIWIGKDEREGIPVPQRPDVVPPPHWRLEAIAQTARPRSLTVSRDGRTAVFIEDRGTSDIYALDLDDPGAEPQALTSGRELQPYWEDAQPRISPNGTTVAYGDDGHVWLVLIAGDRPPRKLVAGGGPVWIDDERLVVAIEHEDENTRKSTRLTVVAIDDLFPARLTRAHDGELDAFGDEEEPAVSPNGSEVAYTCIRRGDLKRGEIRVVDVATGAVRTLTGTPEMADGSPKWSPDGTRVVYVSERSGWHELHTVDRDGANDGQLTHDEADFGDVEWHRDGTRIAAVRGRRGRFDLVLVDPTSGTSEQVAAGGTWDRPAWTANDDLVAGYEDHATPAELRRVTPSKPPRAIRAPAPLHVKRAPHVKPEEVSYPSFDGLEIPAFLFRPRDASADDPIAAIVSPHGGPTAAYIDDHDPRAQYFVDKGNAWLAPNFRGSTGYGRDFERKNHGVWGVDDTKDCIAAADYLATLDWVDGDRLAIVGGSYGSYMATLAVTDDPEHRFRCAVAMYGDVDIVTSWALGDRLGVQDLERRWARRPRRERRTAPARPSTGSRTCGSRSSSPTASATTA
jgi:dipeptidyl aminopeptidase/acylaminoacyl peptidase